MMRRDFADDFGDDFSDDQARRPRRRAGGLRLRIKSGLPSTRWGRIAAAIALLVFLGLCAGAVMLTRNAILHDDRFVIPWSAAIEIQGNEHVTRAQLLSIFGEDVERNIFRVPLEERKAQLERLPWVEHATVMRLLPNRLRISIIERTPVAFVRNGGHIGLVDANGVLLDMPMGVQANMKYSFPVVTGIDGNDPLSVRAARMKIFHKFTADLDSGGEKVSRNLSEVDLSNPEDVRALIPDHSSEVLVHFGEDNFLDRYKKFEEHLPEWKAQYPRLVSVDMRYDQQVVLQMQPGSAVPVSGAPASSPAEPSAHASQNALPASAAPVHPEAKSTPAKKQPAKAAVAHSKPASKHAPPKKAPPSTIYHPPQVVHHP
jgi:cell division protein FtsQ